MTKSLLACREEARFIEPFAFVEADSIPVFESSFADIMRQAALEPDEGLVLSRMDGVLTAGELARLVPLGEQEIFKILYILSRAGFIKFISQKDRENKTKTYGMLKYDLDEVQNQLSASRDYFEIFDLKSTDQTDMLLADLRTNYHRLIAKLHPDRFAEFSDLRALAGELTVQVNEAYSVLRDPGARKNYIETHAPRGQSGSVGQKPRFHQF